MVGVPGISFAQNVNLGSTLSNELNVEVVPSYPGSHETVSVSLTLYTDDLSSADITWYKDGKNALSGKGATRYSFKNGTAGVETKIEIRVDLLSGASFSKSFTLTPANVDLVWEANSYVPPFYKGKALHARQGSLKVVAMPEFVKNGVRVPPANLVYKWSNGVEVYESRSGYGKNTLLLNGSVLGREDEIEVLVTDPGSGLVAENFLTISPSDPEIIFYEDNPYYGHNFDLGIRNSFDLKEEEVELIVAPYFFTKENAVNFKYSWRLNGRAVSELEGSRSAIFKKPEGKSGQSNLSLNIENLNRILQQASAGLVINFED